MNRKISLSISNAVPQSSKRRCRRLGYYVFSTSTFHGISGLLFYENYEKEHEKHLRIIMSFLLLPYFTNFPQNSTIRVIWFRNRLTVLLKSISVQTTKNFNKIVLIAAIYMQYRQYYQHMVHICSSILFWNP